MFEIYIYVDDHHVTHNWNLIVNTSKIRARGNFFFKHVGRQNLFGSLSMLICFPFSSMWKPNNQSKRCTCFCNRNDKIYSLQHYPLFYDLINTLDIILNRKYFDFAFKLTCIIRFASSMHILFRKLDVFLI